MSTFKDKSQIKKINIRENIIDIIAKVKHTHTSLSALKFIAQLADKNVDKMTKKFTLGRIDECDEKYYIYEFDRWTEIQNACLILSFSMGDSQAGVKLLQEKQYQRNMPEANVIAMQLMKKNVTEGFLHFIELYSGVYDKKKVKYKVKRRKKKKSYSDSDSDSNSDSDSYKNVTKMFEYIEMAKQKNINNIDLTIAKHFYPRDSTDKKIIYNFEKHIKLALMQDNCIEAYAVYATYYWNKGEKLKALNLTKELFVSDKNIGEDFNALEKLVVMQCDFDEIVECIKKLMSYEYDFTITPDFYVTPLITAYLKYMLPAINVTLYGKNNKNINNDANVIIFKNKINRQSKKQKCAVCLIDTDCIPYECSHYNCIKCYVTIMSNQKSSRRVCPECRLALEIREEIDSGMSMFTPMPLKSIKGVPDFNLYADTSVWSDEETSSDAAW